MIAGLSLLLLFLNPPDSAEFVVSVCSMGIGLTLAALVVVIGRVAR